MPKDLFSLLRARLEADDLRGVATLLEQQPPAFNAAKADPNACCILSNVRSIAMLDLLLAHGLKIEMVSQWWAPGFNLSTVLPEIALHLIARGASITPHAAAAIGLTDALSQFIDQDPELVHAKGGDGGRPLHFSRNLAIARLLVERGAQIDPRDDDHNSTPAQWRIGEAPEVTRYLLEQGAAADIFMAAALDDLVLARRLDETNPNCTTYRIGNNSGPFPGIGSEVPGGTIYQWTLGFNQSPHEVAYHRGHMKMFDFLWERTPPRQQLLIACMLAHRDRAEKLAREFPALVSELSDEDKALLAKSCWETNLNLEAVRLMLHLGFPVDAPEFNHGYSPLHNAAWCGHRELVALLLERGHPIERRDPAHHSTALGWAIYSCLEAKRHPEGDFAGVVRLLLQAGTPLDEGQYPTGHGEIDAVIRETRLSHG